MAQANNLIQIKRTSVSGRAATTTTLPNPGELALNMADGILYSGNGSFIFEIGANNTNVNVSGNLTTRAIITGGSIGSNGQHLLSNGSASMWHTTFTNSDTPPANPIYGDIWYYVTDNKPYMWVTDGGGSFWYDFLPA